MPRQNKTSTARKQNGAAPSPSGGGAHASGVLGQLKSFYEFMTQNGLEHLELDESGFRLRMVRRKAVSQVPVPVPVQGWGAAPGAAVAAPAANVPAPAAAPAGLTIKAPMMGIFYRASSPSSPPFARDGDAVKPGQVICMIEAMKVFNEVKADFGCRIVRALVENGKAVKSGQDLFVVERV